MDLWVWFALGAAITGFIFLVSWLLKWRDPNWTEEDENRSELWSTRIGGGGSGGAGS